jgi:hypothetical protein
MVIVVAHSDRVREFYAGAYDARRERRGLDARIFALVCLRHDTFAFPLQHRTLPGHMAAARVTYEPDVKTPVP